MGISLLDVYHQPEKLTSRGFGLGNLPKSVDFQNSLEFWHVWCFDIIWFCNRQSWFNLVVAPLRYWLYNIIYTVFYEYYNFVVLGTYVSVFVRRISTSTIQYHWNWNSWFSTTGAGCKLFILLVKVSCFPRIISIRWVPGMVLIKSKSMLGRDVFVLNHFDPTIIFAGRSIQQCTRRKDMNGVQVHEMEPAHEMIETETEHKNTWRLIDSLLDCLWCVTFVVMRVAFFGHGLGVTSAMCQFPLANCP